MVGCVGDDVHGRDLVDGLERERVDTRFIRTASDAPTGVALITVDSRGENTIIVAPGANSLLTPDDVDRAFAAVGRADIVLVQLEIPLDAVRRAILGAERLGARGILNAAPAQTLPDDLLRSADVLVVNEVEACELLGELSAPAPGVLAANLPRGEAGAVIVTLGPKGCVSCAGGGQVREHPPFSVSAVDSTGAGDAFCGGLAVALAEKKVPDAFSGAVRFASAAGALAATRHGAQPSLPSRDEVEHLLSSGREAT
jgi:ribokinase